MKNTYKSNRCYKAVMTASLIVCSMSVALAGSLNPSSITQLKQNNKESNAWVPYGNPDFSQKNAFGCLSISPVTGIAYVGFLPNHNSMGTMVLNNDVWQSFGGESNDGMVVAIKTGPQGNPYVAVQQASTGNQLTVKKLNGT